MYVKILSMVPEKIKDLLISPINIFFHHDLDSLQILCI